MRKFYSLIAMFIMAIAANAQVIKFTEADVAAAGTLDGKTFSSDGLVLTLTDKTDNGKLVIDGNSANFGTLADYQNFTHRLKTGGKSDSKNNLKLTIPADGTLKVYARTASKDSERPIVITQGETEVLNKTVIDSQAETEEYTNADGEKKTRTVFPVYTAEVKAGEAAITYPENAVNFYAFELVSASAPSSKTYTFSASTTPDFDGYVIDEVYYPAAEIATALGLADAAALYDLIKTNTAFYLELPDGTRTNEGFSDPNQPWMNAQSVNQGYGDEGTCWFAGIAADDAEDGTPSVNAWIGDMPGFFKEVYTATDLTAKFYLVNGDKEVAFVFNLHVDAAPEPVEIAEPAKNLSELTIAKEYTMTLKYQEGKQFEGQTTTIDAADMSEVLGTSAEAISSNIEKIFAAQAIKTDDAGSVEFTDSIGFGRFGTDGWFGRYTSFDEATGEEQAIEQNGPKTYGAGCTFYLQSPKYADGQFSIINGQYPGTMKPGDTDYAIAYIINGNKAVKITFNVEIAEAEKVDFSEMTKVGEQEIDADALEVANGYTSILANFDANEILTKLGCAAKDVNEFNFGDDEYSTLIDPTINDFWLSETGVSLNWSDSPCCKLTIDLATGEATLLQMAGKYMEIEEAKTFPMYYILTNGSNYYSLKFNFTLKPVKTIDVETECVATEVVTKQIIPADSYDVEGRYQLDRDYIESVIGTKNFVVYGDIWNEDTESLVMTKNWSCHDAENKGCGFWYGATTHTDSDGKEVVWDEKWNCASTNSFGFQLFPDYSIGFFQMPGQRSAGDEFTGNIYLMNEDNGKYIKFVCNVKYVEEYAPETETVGTETIVYEATDDIVDADGYYSITPDMTAAYEALGITAADIESATIVAPKSQYTFGTYDAEEQIVFGKNGYVTNNEDNAAYTAFLSIAADGTPMVKVDIIDVDLDVEEATTVVVRIGLEYEGKRYMHEITLANKAAYTSIEGVKATTTSAIYSLTGVKLNALQKGINIVNGKKVLVK